MKLKTQNSKARSTGR